MDRLEFITDRTEEDILEAKEWQKKKTDPNFKPDLKGFLTRDRLNLLHNAIETLVTTLYNNNYINFTFQPYFNDTDLIISKKYFTTSLSFLNFLQKTLKNPFVTLEHINITDYINYKDFNKFEDYIRLLYNESFINLISFSYKTNNTICGVRNLLPTNI